ncbi:MAG: hypothetical protein ACJ8EB_05555 [Allosphingosinicella sp.]
MVRLLLSSAAALAACTPSPQENAMHSRSRESGTTKASVAPNRGGAGGGSPERAAVGPIPEPVSVADNPLPAPTTDSPAAAEGRRTLSTAFVRVGPDGFLTVELRDGRVLALRDVVLRRKDYCGVQLRGGGAGAKFCGGYADVAAARPGGAPAPEQPDPAASSPRGPGKGN